MEVNTEEGGRAVKEPIIIPYNAKTAHIYETCAKIAWEIVERNAALREKENGKAV